MQPKTTAPAATPWARSEPAPAAGLPAVPQPAIWAPKPPAKRARASKSPNACPADAAERIQAVASKGGSIKGLHSLFGVSAEVFKRWMDDDASLRKAFDEGKEQEREALHRTMYEAAIFRKDLTAAQFLLKTRHGYREQEPEDVRNSVRIVFNLPPAAPDLKTYIDQTAVLPAVEVPRAVLSSSDE